MQLVGYTAPVLGADLHLSKVLLGYILSANNLGFMVGALLLSTLGDRIGRKRMVLVGVVLFGAFTLALAHSSSFETVLAFRFLSGVGLGGAVPNVIALAAEYAPARRRATAVSLLFVAYTVGSAVAGFTASWLMGAHGWRILFDIGGYASVALAVLLAWRLPESVRFYAARNRGAQSERDHAPVRPGFRLDPARDGCLASRGTLAGGRPVRGRAGRHDRVTVGRGDLQHGVVAPDDELAADADPPGRSGDLAGRAGRLDVPRRRHGREFGRRAADRSLRAGGGRGAAADSRPGDRAAGAGDRIARRAGPGGRRLRIFRGRRPETASTRCRARSTPRRCARPAPAGPTAWAGLARSWDRSREASSSPWGWRTRRFFRCSRCP